MKKVVTLYILILFMNPLFSQVISKREFAKELEDADIIYNYGEDYEKAANIYTKLLKSNPDNSNLTAKLGMCYLYMDGKKPESLKLLKKAFQNAASTDAEYTPTGIKAPVNTWMYLAQAYSQNDSINKALEIYNGAKRAYGGTDPKVAEFIENRINDCKLMLQQKKAPLVAIPTLFTPWLRDYPGACSPVISKNDSVFVFTQKQGVKTRVFCSYNNGTWQPPINITDMLGGYDRFYTNSITGDGKFLVLFMDDGEDGNLYYSERRGSTWSKIKSMGSPINTIYWESHGFITPDGKHIYIASNRPGSKGRSDIWLSDKNPDGSWTRPENLGDADYTFLRS